MRAALRGLHSPDAKDLETYQPNGAAFSLLVQAMIGPNPGKGEESFDFVVCSPAWLLEKARHKGYVVPRHHLVVESYDFATIQSAIGKICGEAKGDDWSTLASYIGRFGKWEFEDYRP
jgi:hypothetical protein